MNVREQGNTNMTEMPGLNALKQLIQIELAIRMVKEGALIHLLRQQPDMKVVMTKADSMNAPLYDFRYSVSDDKNTVTAWLEEVHEDIPVHKDTGMTHLGKEEEC